MNLTNAQLNKAVEDIREMINEVYNEHSEMKAQIRELRVAAGIETAKESVSGPEINTPTDNTCGMT